MLGLISKESEVNEQYQLNTVRNIIVIFISPFMAVVWFFHIGVGHNFDSNFLEREREMIKPNKIPYRRYMLYMILLRWTTMTISPQAYSSKANQNDKFSTLKML